MPRVDFYILPDADPAGRMLFTCRLAEKIHALGHTIYIHTADESAARHLDERLWTFNDGSFVPHALCPAPPADASPILIGWGTDTAATGEVLINLSADVPPAFARFERVAEVANQQAEVLAASRQRFRFYKAQGIEPGTHKL